VSKVIQTRRRSGRAGLRWLTSGLGAAAACAATDAASTPPSDAGPDGALTFVPGGDAARDLRCGPCGRECAPGEVCVADACAPAAGSPPRPLAPASLGRATSQRPTLRWLLPAGAGGARVTVCRDRECEQVVHAADVAGASLRLPEALPAGVYYWRVLATRGSGLAAQPSATWEFQVRAREAGVDTAIGGLGDIDGDGYSDLVMSVGTPPRAGVYTGGPAGLSRTPTAAVPRQADGTSARTSTVGDLNGDGYSDLLSSETVDGARRVTLRPGGPRGAAPAPVPLAPDDPWPATLGGAGDVDGDGYADLMGMDQGATGPQGQVRIFFGSPAGVRPRSRVMIAADPAEPTGLTSGGGGDANGDGRPDFIFGRPAALDGAGRAFVWLSTGSCGDGRVVALPGDVTPRAHFGDALTLSGDLDGDGYADAVVAAPHEADETDRSALWIFPGGAAGPVTADPARIRFAGRQMEAIALVGGADVNGDGFTDLGAWFHTSTRGPELGLFYGSATGLPSAPSRTLTVADYGPGESGFSVGTAGDTDRDGFDDLTVYLTPGRVVISRGSPGGPTTGVLAPLLPEE